MKDEILAGRQPLCNLYIEVASKRPDTASNIFPARTLTRACVSRTRVSRMRVCVRAYVGTWGLMCIIMDNISRLRNHRGATIEPLSRLFGVFVSLNLGNVENVHFLSIVQKM